MRAQHLLLSVMALVGLASFLQAAAQVRQPAWAGRFYDADPARLAVQLDLFLRAGTAAAPGRRPAALIAPHAGYVYSGATAGRAYAVVAGLDYETVVIVAPSHHVGFDGCSVDEADAIETPLGVVAVDKGAARLLRKEPRFGFVDRAHAAEHALEVQVPFIQKALPGAKVVPVIMGSQDGDMARTLAEALARLAKSRKILVVASTDMSHFLPKSEARALDASTLDLITSRSTAALLRKIERRENVLCGGGGVVAAILYAQKLGATAVELLGYADSSEAGGPETGVVGYCAAALYPSRAEEPAAVLSAEDKRELLRVARRSVEEAIATGSSLSYRTDKPSLLVKRGAFVTLTKKGDLRGCIGFIEPIYPLAEVVIQTAAFAALKDVRFRPVTSDELKDIEIEISVLTPLTRITDPGLVQVGKHGLVISQGERKGLLLPQVATEYGWTREEFLAQACLKAGLPRDAWKKGAEISTFEAVVFR